MSYCDVQDVRNALIPGGASTETNTAADVPDAAIQDAIDEAMAIVDAFVGGPYESTDFIPGIVLYWTRDIAAYYATLTWRKSKAPSADNPVVTRYQHAIEMLQSIAEGGLDIPSPADIPDQGTVVNPADALVASQNGTLFNPADFDLTGRSQGPSFDRWPGFYF
jgi:phage gp36-like protein